MLELAPREGSQVKHTYLKRSGTKLKKNIKPKLEKLPQNNGLVGFNKGMTYAEKEGEQSKVKLSKKSFKVPPGGHSSLDLFSQSANIPDPRELKKQFQLRPLSQQQEQQHNASPPPKYANSTYDQQRSKHDNFNQQQPSAQYSRNDNYNQQQSSAQYPRNDYHNQQQSCAQYSRNDNYNQQCTRNDNYNQQQSSAQYPRNDYHNQQQSSAQYSRNDNNGYPPSSMQPKYSNGNYEAPPNSNYQSSTRSNIFQDNEVPLYGGRSNKLSSNTFANGSNQNCGNVITERSSTRLHAPPGGLSSLSLAHPEPPQRQQLQPTVNRQQQQQQQQQQREEHKAAPMENGRTRPTENRSRANESSTESVGSIGQLLKKGNKLISEFGDDFKPNPTNPVNKPSKSSIPRISQPNRGSLQRMEPTKSHNPLRVPGLENHYSEGQRRQFGM
jgi:hypothetical protein